uniref:PQ-loop repeat-containing protein n=1 Tax=Aetokthonos hydrillicola TaxID=1550245 RepID=UPI001ABA2FAD
FTTSRTLLRLTPGDSPSYSPGSSSFICTYAPPHPPTYFPHVSALSCFITFVTFLLLGTTPTSPPSETVEFWITFLGVVSALLCAGQYAPQLAHTYRMKLVGALSIPMMCIQSPGAVLMVLSIALRPGTNWTSADTRAYFLYNTDFRGHADWITFALAGVMQGSLLVMCIMWKFRQNRLQIDDFGHSLMPDGSGKLRFLRQPTPCLRFSCAPGDIQQEDSPIPVTQGPDDGESIAEAVEDAVDEDVRTVANESTPLLVKQGQGEDSDGPTGSGFLSWNPWKR